MTFSSGTGKSWPRQKRRVYLTLPLFINAALAESAAATAGMALSDVENALERLVGLGLVELQKTALDSPPRYSLHPLSRAFARAKMDEIAGFELLARERQLDWYIELAGQVGYCWHDLAKLGILDPEEKTLHDLVMWATSHGEYSRLLPLIRGIDYFYYIRGLKKGDFDLGFLRVFAASQIGDRLEEIKALALCIQTLSREQRLTEAGNYLKRLEELSASLALPDELLFEVQYTLGLYRMARQEFSGDYNLGKRSALARRVSARAFAVARGYLAICFYRQGQTQAAENLWQAILADTGAGRILARCDKFADWPGPPAY